MSRPPNRLGDFLAGVQSTFGIYASTAGELAAFLRAAETFYLDFVGATRLPSAQLNATTSLELPFWRYLLHYTALALDQAANDERIDQQDVSKHQDTAAALAACWPFLAVIATGQHADQDVPPHQHRADSATASTSSSLGNNAANINEPILRSERSDIGVQTDSSTSTYIRTPEEPLVPPVQHSFAYSPPPTTSSQAPCTLGRPQEVDSTANAERSRYSPESFSTRSAGRTLSASTDMTDTSTSTAQSEPMPITPPQSSAGPAVTTSMDKNSQPRQGGSYFAVKPVYDSSSASTPKAAAAAPSRTPSSYGDSAAMKLILADRGDNTARLVPMPDGAYVLDITIGGRKLLVRPENPTEIQYHDSQGFVVTHSLLPAQTVVTSDAS